MIFDNTLTLNIKGFSTTCVNIADFVYEKLSYFLTFLTIFLPICLKMIEKNLGSYF
jgi:hypothetical protein